MTDTTQAAGLMDDLPPLPDYKYWIDAGCGDSVHAYSADQMRAYARALAAQKEKTNGRV